MDFAWLIWHKLNFQTKLQLQQSKQINIKKLRVKSPTIANTFLHDGDLQILDNGSVTPSVLWDAAKAVMRGKIIALTSRLKKTKGT